MRVNFGTQRSKEDVESSSRTEKNLVLKSNVGKLSTASAPFQEEKAPVQPHPIYETVLKVENDSQMTSRSMKLDDPN